MAFLLETALSNLIVATLLAGLAALAGWWGRRPAVTHALWLLVLLKLVTPPLFYVPIDWPAALPQQAQNDVEAPVRVEAPVEDVIPPWPWLPLEPGAPLPEPKVDVAVLPVVALAPEVAPAEMLVAWPWVETIVAIWIAGTLAWLVVAAIRIRRFHRLLSHALPACEKVQAKARELAEAMDIRCPEICLVPGQISPLLWTFTGPPRLVLPAGLLDRLDADQLASLLAHELAHWQRRDDRVRWLELIVLALYWWCPLAWWARRELHQAEEDCCDAWVVSLLPGSAKAYALALVQTVDFLTGAPAALPVSASGLGHVRQLQRRLSMILQGKTPRSLGFTWLLAVAGVGLLLLPMMPTWAQPPGTPGGLPPQPGDPGKKKADAELDKLRAEVKRLHDELDARRTEMDKRADQLRELMEHIRQMEKKGQPPMGGGQKGGKGGDPAPKGGNIPGGFGRGGFVPGGGVPFPGGGGWGGGGFKPATVEQRLNNVERNLEAMLQELRAIRTEMKGGPRPGGGPNPNPNPMPGGPNGFIPNAPPVPPQPPRPPLGPNQDEGAK